jgi:hypothetical protein
MNEDKYKVITIVNYILILLLFLYGAFIFFQKNEFRKNAIFNHTFKVILFEYATEDDSSDDKKSNCNIEEDIKSLVPINYFGNQNFVGPLLRQGSIRILLFDIINKKSLLEKVLLLNKNIMLGFNPYIDAKVVKTFLEYGFDVYLEALFEPYDYPIVDPGVLGIYTFKTFDENIENIKNSLNSFQGCSFKGFYSSYLEKFSANLDVLKKITSYINNQNYLFILNKADYTKSALNNMVFKPDSIITIDMLKNPQDYDEFVSVMNKLIFKALESGDFININVKSHEIVVEHLSKWLSSLDQNVVYLSKY